MELLVASAIGLLTAVGVYLVLRRHSFPVIIGTAFLSYAVNLFLFATGRLAIDRPPIITPGRGRLYGPAAAGTGSHRYRDLLRHDRAHRGAGPAGLPRNGLGPGRGGRPGREKTAQSNEGAIRP